MLVALQVVKLVMCYSYVDNLSCNYHDINHVLSVLQKHSHLTNTNQVKRIDCNVFLR